MDIVRGSIVKSKAGHDKGEYLVVTDIRDKEAYVCDGKGRKTVNPKRKNVKHLCPTGKVMEMPQTDKQIRKMLNSMKA